MEEQDCLCPVDKTKTEEFRVVVHQGERTQSFMVRLSANVLGYLANPTIILIVVGVLLAGLFLVAGLIYALGRLGKR